MRAISGKINRHNKMKNLKLTIVILLILAAGLAGMIGRCFYLQFIKADHYHQESIRPQEATIIEKPCRGIILDCRGRVLAASNRTQSVFADPCAIEDVEKAAQIVSGIFNVPPNAAASKITGSKNPRFVRLAESITPKQRDAILAARVHGIGIMNDYLRHYPSGPIASHAVGFVNSENAGLGGVELQYNSKLEGMSGTHIFYADAARRLIRLKEQKDNVIDGMGLVLTIDGAIQSFAYTELIKQYKAFQAESAIAIVMDPYTGAILAMVCLPDFEPEKIISQNPDTFRNRALTDPYEPGSIFKPIVAAIAIDGGAVRGNSVIFCENGTYSGKGFGTIGEYNRHKYGNMTVQEILEESSNIGMAKIGQKMGKQMLYNGLKSFGFGQPTGIDLPGEGTGVLWPMSRWTGYSVTRIPFGQEISVTGLQIARAFSILANGGRPIRPYVLKAVIDNDGNVVEFKRPGLPAGVLIKPEVAKWMTEEALTGVVKEGTGKKAALKKWQVFGKTGTANIAKTGERGFSENEYVASFVGGAPANDPKVVVLVSVRKPNRRLGKGYTGGTVAAPVVAGILDKTLTYLKVPPDEVDTVTVAANEQMND
jgi:cell division protein FtsI/penicillin-binding protein 2